jgi:small-conductance mechanosensitive channel
MSTAQESPAPGGGPLLDGQRILRSLVEHGLRIVVIIVLAFLIFKAVKSFLDRLERRLNAEDSQAGRSAHRSHTLVGVMRGAFSIAIWTVTSFMVLDEIGLNLSPLLTGAGIAGIALGFGAQSLVRDFLTGFFVLLEDQYRVGDLIEIQLPDEGNVRGKVERFSLRATSLRGSDGTLHQVANGMIQVVSNRSAGWSRAIIDIGVSYREDLARVREALLEAGNELVEDEELGPFITEAPEILGVQELGESQVTIRMAARTLPGKQTVVARALRQRIKEAFDRQGIRKAGE